LDQGIGPHFGIVSNQLRRRNKPGQTGTNPNETAPERFPVTRFPLVRVPSVLVYLAQIRASVKTLRLIG
jgi:hypothetical protein